MPYSSNKSHWFLKATWMFWARKSWRSCAAASQICFSDLLFIPLRDNLGIAAAAHFAWHSQCHLSSAISIPYRPNQGKQLTNSNSKTQTLLGLFNKLLLTEMILVQHCGFHLKQIWQFHCSKIRKNSIFMTFPNVLYLVTAYLKNKHFMYF